jgi:hypothetical protein
MKKQLLPLTFFFCFLANNIYSSHFAGGEIEYKWISGNRYEFKLTLFRNCKGIAAPDNITLCFYDKVSDSSIVQFTIDTTSIDTFKVGDKCFTPPYMKIQKAIYCDTITIPSNPNGYYIVYSSNGRNGSIDNVVSGNFILYTEMPDPAMHNSGPRFLNYPRGYFCWGSLNYEYLTASDIDGDSLVYKMIVPSHGTGTCAPKPSGGYSKATYKTGYSDIYPLGTSTALVNQPFMDPKTGIMSANPYNIGFYLLGYTVEEYRGGVKIGEVRREMQYSSIYCTSAPISALVSQSGHVLTSLDSNVHYQWVTCNLYSSIQGDTNQTLSSTQNGTYAVIVTSGTCKDTSSCFVIGPNGIDDPQGENDGVLIYPNPANGKIVVDFKNSSVNALEIINELGQVVYSCNVVGLRSKQVDISGLVQGIYFIRISEAATIQTRRILIE